MTASNFEVGDSANSVQRAVAAVQRISAVPALLRVVCDVTGMGFAAVARVTEGTWTACAVQDDIGFGLEPGGQLDLATTLCMESRLARQVIAIDHASQDPVYRSHHTPRIYKIESYVSVPIIQRDGTYFGNLCAIDPQPRTVSNAGTVAMFTAYANLIALQLENEDRYEASETALHAARETAELREQFVAILGHDLRNPLAAISATAALLIRRAEEPEYREMGRRISVSTQRMSRLIDDVLDFTRSRMGSGIGVVKTAVTDLGGALRDVVAEIRETCQDRQILETIAIEGSVFCDRGRIQQLLSNLLGNAVHHGAASEPIVVEAHTAEGWVVMTVANRGRPISPDELGKIFEPYWRSPTSTPGGGGLGLGLHICSQIVQTHGGTLAATSSAEDGTRFTARIPTR